jgi:hypothetical protein
MQTLSANPTESDVVVAPVFTWTVFRLSNELRRDVIVRAINEHFHLLQTADVIWNLSAAYFRAFSDGDIEAILNAARAHGVKRRDARTVFVCSDPAVLDVISAYMSAAKQADMTVDYAVVATQEEAERWLTCNREHRCGEGSHEPGSPKCPRGSCRALRLFQSYRRFKGNVSTAPCGVVRG